MSGRARPPREGIRRRGALGAARRQSGAGGAQTDDYRAEAARILDAIVICWRRGSNLSQSSKSLPNLAPKGAARIEENP